MVQNNLIPGLLIEGNCVPLLGVEFYVMSRNDISGVSGESDLDGDEGQHPPHSQILILIVTNSQVD
ncbi:MAG: hypothetical protein OXE84_03700 [Rhodobacteraceae bacterium]|nr:hypothetical protein [Paracoccaceae bacterium]